MAHRFPFSSGARTCLFVVLLALLILQANCGKQDGTPPPPPVKPVAAPTSSTCCRIAPTTGLHEGMGRLVVAFPDHVTPTQSSVVVLKDGEQVQSGYGNQTWDLEPGTYDVLISEKPVSGVAVQVGHETQVKVGLLHLNALEQTHIGLLDPISGKELVSSYGEQSYGLPIGTISVQVAGLSESVTIEDGTITEF